MIAAENELLAFRMNYIKVNAYFRVFCVGGHCQRKGGVNQNLEAFLRRCSLKKGLAL